MKKYLLRFLWAFSIVKEADIIIAESSKPSVWLGMEIREADREKKSIIIIAKTGAILSWLILGCPAVKEIFLYDDEILLKNMLPKIIKKLIEIN